MSANSQASERIGSAPSCEAAVHRYRFANVEVDFRAAELRRSGVRVRIQDQPLHLLAVLLSRPGELVSREELRQLLWTENTFVDFDHSLNSAVKRLRDVLNDSPENPRLIETVPRHGYRFIAPVSEIEPVERRPVASHPANRSSVCCPDEAGVSPKEPPVQHSNRHSRIYLHLSVLLLLAVSLAGLHTLRARARRHVAPPGATLAILPFHDLSERGAGASLGAGMTQELVTRLGKLEPKGVVLLAPVSNDQPSHPGTLSSPNGGKVEADYVVQGSIRVQATQARIAMQLIRVKDRQFLWTEAYDEGAANVLATQRKVADAVARAVCEHLKLSSPVN